jgi:ankyrin repeat protein
MFAAVYGFTGVARALPDGGANPNIVPTDDTGWTALIAAACRGHAEVTQLLLDRGADAAATDKTGGTALACARDNRHADVVSILRTQKRKR